MAAVADPREPAILSESAQPDWNAIGRVNVAGLKTRGMCSGTLISPDLVLTAAHCVTRDNGRVVRPGDIHFVAGWRSGEYAAHRLATEVLPDPGYDASAPVQAERIQFDIAFIRLAAPISEKDIAPIPVADRLREAAPLAIVGYRRDRPHAPSIQTECAVVWEGRGAIGLDCPVVEGTSGAPVLLETPDGWRVVGLVDASVSGGGTARSLAAKVGPERFP